MGVLKEWNILGDQKEYGAGTLLNIEKEENLQGYGKTM